VASLWIPGEIAARPEFWPCHRACDPLPIKLLLAPGLVLTAFLVHYFYVPSSEIATVVSWARSLGIGLASTILAMGLIAILANEASIKGTGLPLASTIPGWLASTAKWPIILGVITFFCCWLIAGLEWWSFALIPQSLALQESVAYVQVALVATLVLAASWMLQTGRRNEADLEQLRDLERAVVFSHLSDTEIEQKINDVVLGQQLGPLVAKRIDEIRGLGFQVRDKIAGSKSLESLVMQPSVTKAQRAALLDQSVSEFTRLYGRYTRSVRGLLSWLRNAIKFGPVSQLARDVIDKAVKDLEAQTDAVSSDVDAFYETVNRLSNVDQRGTASPSTSPMTSAPDRH
jgi:hypothetical protein